jgi:hypothetical protein
MPPSKNGAEHNLVRGKLYTFKHPVYKNMVFKGVFVKHTYDWIYRQSCVFDKPNSLAIPSRNLKVMPSTEPMLAKQYARGLSEYIPEDCAGIIERMLVGDRIVGQGPDRYPERTV